MPLCASAPRGASSKRPALDDEENVMNYHGPVKRLDLPAGNTEIPGLPG
jgi:hypothetical protein